MYRHLSIDIVSDKEVDDSKSSSDAPSTPPRKTAISKASVESSLAHFFQPEVREIKCEKCEEGTHAEQTLHILKRYVSSQSYAGVHVDLGRIQSDC